MSVETSPFIARAVFDIVGRCIPENKPFLRFALMQCQCVRWTVENNRLKLTLVSPGKGIDEIIAHGDYPKVLNNLAIDLTLVSRK